MKCNKQLKNSNYVAFSHFHGTDMNNSGLQIVDIEVPHGDWGKASYLEPITQDFPEFGAGGATQVITHSEIEIDTITNLPK